MARELLYLFQYPIGHLCQNDWRKRFLNGFKKKREVGRIDQVEPLCFVFRNYTNIHLLILTRLYLLISVHLILLRLTR
ncbi:hypothetical protein AREALGSMS7_01628 [Arenibacter algicola]|uniref:Uncharacterized protein n=1 Tax=Arenibacter algicola TaxID=616991 RepID=A0A221UVG8_9FLAO|nr:hypothetical protein AREALGSMS7_01628 [Arenibacter algicola]